MSKTRKQKMGFIKTKGVAGWTMVSLKALDNYKKNIESVADDNDIIDIGDWSGARNQILQTKIDWFQDDMPETDFSKQEENIKKFDNEYFAFRRKINSLTPQQKAQRLEMFNLLYWGMTKKHEIPEDTKTKAIEIQEKFFIENPKRILCEPILFKSLFKESKGFIPAITIIERTVSVDTIFSR